MIHSTGTILVRDLTGKFHTDKTKAEHIRQLGLIVAQSVMA